MIHLAVTFPVWECVVHWHVLQYRSWSLQECGAAPGASAYLYYQDCRIHMIGIRTCFRHLRVMP